MASRPPIPPRASSKRPHTELVAVNDDLRRKRKKLTPSGSFDADYWKAAVEVVEAEQQRNALRRQISYEEFKASGASEEEWASTKEAQELHLELERLKFSERKFREQVKRVEAGDASASTTIALRRSYLELFISSKKGLNVTAYGGGRSTEDQSGFRKALIQAYNAEHPDPAWADYLWCPILSRWLAREHVTASHLFSSRHGQPAMDAIFGETDEPELFSPLNGLVISSHIETKFESGLFAIVPDVPDEPTPDDLQQWHNSRPREYKLKIINKDAKILAQMIPYVDKTWKELDGKKLEFRSDFRPRARYLYFHYCLQVLRHAFTERFQGETLRQSELTKPAWASPGKYIKRHMLLAFVEEIGHKYDHLLQGSADQGDSNDPNDFLLATATNQMQLGLNRSEKGKDAEEDSEAEDSDEDEDIDKWHT